MIKRYQVDKIEQIWNDQFKYETWLKVEQLVVYALQDLKLIDEQDLSAISNLKVDLNRMLEIEQHTKHDVVAFTKMLSEQINHSVARWIHFGLTSTDVVDTAQNYLIKLSNEIVEQELKKLQSTLKKIAYENIDILIMGRTHGMYGEPTSLGLKFTLWYDEINRQLQRLKLARKQIEVAKISGSMGNYANTNPAVEKYVAKKLELNLDLISTQVTQRDRHAFLISTFANVASTFEKISTEIRLFQRSDVNEMAESFAANQKGSSSMPHKKNPISSENIAGLSRYIRSFVSMSYENNNLWHERDISHSSNERIVLPDLYHCLTYLIIRLNDTLSNLYINYEQIANHISDAKNIFWSQRLLSYIIQNNKDYNREQIYDFIQKCSLQATAQKQDFIELLIKNNVYQYISKDQFEKLFDLQFFNKHTELIFKRVFEK